MTEGVGSAQTDSRHLQLAAARALVGVDYMNHIISTAGNCLSGKNLPSLCEGLCYQEQRFAAIPTIHIGLELIEYTIGLGESVMLFIYCN